MPDSDFHPLVKELLPPPRPEDAFARLRCWPHCLFLDSARRDPLLGRYSFLTADPFDYIELPLAASDHLAMLSQRTAAYHSATVADLPPFQGGAAGLFSYDLGRQWEAIPPARVDEFELPGLAVGLYDVVLAWDHGADRAWLVSQGWPETDPEARQRRAQSRLNDFLACLAAPPPTFVNRDSLPPVDHPSGCPTNRFGEVLSNFSRRDYLGAICRVIEYIRAGDVFQVNLAQRLIHPADGDAAALYLRLRQRNPAPFAGYFDLGGFQILSASPERFLSVAGREVETRPIKGTRRRMLRPEADLFSGDELRSSEKDRAENVMIVDLLRNDLSRVCEPESVYVDQLCRLETYEYVQHLVSSVRGRLRPEHTPLDLLRAAFPGGSITGAPKVRAMQIISELEPTARGAYCGSLGYLGFDGSTDLNILIRTITAGRGWWQMPVGGGIVAQSVPEREYEETWDKAEGMLRALGP